MKLPFLNLRPQPRVHILKTYDTAVETPWRMARRIALLAILVGILIVYGFYYALVTPWGLVQMVMPLGVMILLIIWALPDMDRAPTTLMQQLFFAYLACFILWPNYLAISLPGLPWITLVRLTGFPMVFTFLVSLSVSPSFRGHLKGVLQTTPFLSNLLVIFAVLMVLSVGLSKSPQFSIQRLIVGEVNWIAMFFVAAYVFSKVGNAKIWAYMVLVIFAAMCVVGIVDVSFHKVPWAGHVPSFLKIGDPVVERMISAAYRSASGEYRVKAVFTTPLALGEFMALCLPIILHFVLSPFPRPARFAALLLIPIGYAVIESSGSRLGMVGSMIGMLLYTLMWGITRWRRNRTSLLAPAVILGYPAFAVVTFLASLSSNYLRRRIWGDGATKASDAGRAHQLAEGLPKVAHNPFGYGIGRAAETLGLRGSGDVLTIDNYFLSIALEYGVIGFFVFYGMIVAAVIYAVRVSLSTRDDPEMSLSGPLAVSLATFIIMKWAFSQQDNHALVFMMMGAVAGLAWRHRQESMATATPSLRSVAVAGGRQTALAAFTANRA